MSGDHLYTNYSEKLFRVFVCGGGRGSVTIIGGSLTFFLALFSGLLAMLGTYYMGLRDPTWIELCPLISVPINSFYIL